MSSLAFFAACPTALRWFRFGVFGGSAGICVFPQPVTADGDELVPLGVFVKLSEIVVFPQSVTADGDELIPLCVFVELSEIFVFPQSVSGQPFESM